MSVQDKTTDERPRLFIIERPELDFVGQDEYDFVISAVVVALNAEAARLVHPKNTVDRSYVWRGSCGCHEDMPDMVWGSTTNEHDYDGSGSWVPPEFVQVKEIGYALLSIPLGTVLHVSEVNG